MSEDKRKNARLQGRFSDEHRSSRKEKPKRTSGSHSDDGSSKSSSGKNRSSDSKSLQSLEGFNLKFDKHANVSFEQFEEKKKPVEISTKGEHILSTTENGISRVMFEPDFISKDDADEMMTIINVSTKWYDKNIIIHGQEVPQPRLVAWYGPFPYAYSGAILEAAEMPPLIAKIRDKAESYLKEHGTDVHLNSVLLNLYRNEKDSVAWHSDDELSLGVCPTIASVSLGAIRKFQMKPKPHVCKNDPSFDSKEYFVNLTPGSLVVMDGCMQKDWKHQVPKEYHDRPPRINLTFRTVFPSDTLPIEVPLKSVENSNKFSHSVKEEKTHIFDNDNFPPLGSTNLQRESISPKSQNSHTGKNDNITETYTSSTNQNFPNPWEFDSKDNKTVDLNAEEQPVASNQNFDTMTENGNSYVTASIGVSDTLDVQVCFVSEVSIKDNEFEADVDKYDRTSAEYDDSTSSSITEKSDSDQKRRYELNAEAPEYIPKCHNFSNKSTSHSDMDFSNASLTKLAELFDSGKVTCPQFGEFFKVITDRITQNPSFFFDRDHYELDVLCKLNDGSQSERNQNIILKRICSMIQNVAAKSRRSNFGYPGSQPNRYYREGNRSNRGSSSYKGPSYRKNYKD